MSEPTKIIVAGIGGVGGYFGGLLAKKYANSAVEVYFIARGEHLRQIREHGLKVIKGKETFVAQPFLATDDASTIGSAAYILVCTKNYDLEGLVEQLRPCIGKHTVILPLLNGIEGVEKIRKLVPQALVPSGCVYIVSAIKEPGVIENIGSQQRLFFGLDQAHDERLVKLEQLSKEAAIDATLSADISQIIWQKFIFLSSLATASSYYDQSVGQLLEQRKPALIQLITEVSALAKAKGVAVDPAVLEKSIAHYETLPYEATSSMHRDFKASRPTELESLTGYVVKQAQLMGIETPHFNTAYVALANK